MADIVAVPEVAPNVPYYTPAIHATTSVFVYHVATGSLSRVLQTPAFTAWPDANVTNLSLSADGRYLVFATADTQMGGYTSYAIPGGSTQIYRADLTTGAIIVVSRSSTTATSGCNGICANPEISSDGLSVVYDSDAVDLQSTVVNPGFAQVYLSKSDGTSTTLVSRGPTAAGSMPRT